MFYPRIETIDTSSFITSKTRDARLWFVNNPTLEQAILGRLARWADKRTVSVHAFAIEGNHIHISALFPEANRASFMRDFNSGVARDVIRHQHDYVGGPLLRTDGYSSEVIPTNADAMTQFFYIVLQPVQDGLVDDITDYPYYNCFEDAIKGVVKTYKVVKWKEYHDAIRYGNPHNYTIEDFLHKHEFKFVRLPGFEDMNQDEYEKMMRNELKIRTQLALENREVKSCLGADRLKRVRPGSMPHSPKLSTPFQDRPRVSSKQSDVIESTMAWMDSIAFAFHEASRRWLAGDDSVEFPPGTYRPPRFNGPTTSEGMLAKLNRVVDP